MENGAGRAAPAQRLIDELAELVVAAQVQVDELQEQLAEARETVTRYQRALDALSGEKRKTSGGGGKVVQPKHWVVSEERIAFVWELARKQTEPFTQTALADSTPGVSAETVRRACAVLRERELLRVTGRARGGGALLAVMPGAEHKAANGT